MPGYELRRQKLVRHVKRDGVDALLVADPVNVRYLTGFHGEDSRLLIGPGMAVILSDRRFETELRQECREVDVALRGPGETWIDLAARVLPRRGVRTLAVEGHAVSCHDYQLLEKTLDRVCLKPVAGWVEQLRQIKDREEIRLIQQAIDVAQRAMQAVWGGLHREKTEWEVAAELEYQIRRMGGEGSSFPPIVAAGPRAALPHARPLNQPVGRSPFLLVDWGARWQGYCSDLTRMFVLDKIPPKLQRLYDVVRAAQRCAIQKIRPGVSLGQVDRAARAVIEQEGMGRRFGHGLGHGIGLHIHEAPRLAPGAVGSLRAGMVVTVEPGVYLPGWGGVRIEDDVLVTRTGHRILTSWPHELQENRLL